MTQAVTPPSSVYPKNHDAFDNKELIDASKSAVTAELREGPDKKTTAIVILSVVCVTLISSLTSGVVVVALPTIAEELHLGPEVLLWCGYHV